MTGPLAGVDRDTLLAERAEAEAQLRAAEATLGIPPASEGQGENEQEPGEPTQKPLAVDGQPVAEVPALDVDGLRRAAQAAREADDALARAASATLEGDQLAPAESAISRALQVRENLPAAWRRLVGALISATGMAIVVGALGWNVYWLLVPIALIAILTVDLRVAGRSARDATAEVAVELAAVGGADGLARIEQERAGADVAEARLEAARAERDAAYARFEALAPGRLPSEADEIIAQHEAELAAARAAAAATAEEAAARQAAAEAGRHLAAELAHEAAEAPAEPADEAPAEEPVVSEAPSVVQPVAQPAAAAPATASEWWFGSQEAPAAPAAASAPVRALAERLSAEGREALARIEAQLAALERVELAKRSLEWHEANGSGGAEGTNGEKP